MRISAFALIIALLPLCSPPALAEDVGVQGTLDKYAQGKAKPLDNNYNFEISIDNETDTFYDDSIFAWDYYHQGGGGLATGHQWKAHDKGYLVVNSGGCVKSGGGDVYEKKVRTQLDRYGDAGEGYCWTGFGWRIYYEDVSHKTVKVDVVQTKTPIKK